MNIDKVIVELDNFEVAAMKKIKTEDDVRQRLVLGCAILVIGAISIALKAGHDDSKEGK